MNYVADLYPMSPEDVALHAAPLTHGSGALMHSLIAKGSNNVILKSKRFEVKVVFEVIEKERVTILPFLEPTMIKMLLVYPDLHHYDLSTLKCIIYGGAPMYVEDLKEAIRRFGPILVQIYGQAEAPATISYLRKEEHVLNGTEEQTKHLSSAGIARTDVEVKIFSDNDNEVACGELGEIVARGKILMKGYWRNPEAAAETLRHGWLHTGDVGYMDEKGFLYIMDRKKDMVISGGSNIYSREVEDVILRHPAVQEVAVIGVPDSVWGESVKAIVVLRQEAKASQEEIIEFCKKNMASYKKPKSVDFVDGLPKSAYGKVQKTILREKYWEGRERRV
jgi:acyl-CoA synthetase (AMP-forming)/AMP-acid ligase II